jgi:hypothetical protein
MFIGSRLLLASAFLILFSACNSLVEESSFDGAPSMAESLADASFDAASKGRKQSQDGPGGLTVMTRNLYIGTDVSLVLTADSREQIPVLAAEAFQTLLSTNFPERAEALADEIAETMPHVVGIQEASLIRIQSPSDAVTGGTAPAVDVVFDYLEILLAALDARGLDYRVAGSIQNVDVEIPMVTGMDPLTFSDIRVTDFDVILARRDVEISRVTESNFQAELPLSSLGTSLPRGYVAVDATISNRIYRIVNTHLEPFHPQVQSAQAQELLAVLDSETLPIVLLGDFNSPAPAGDTYQFLLSEGYVDVWTRSVKPKGGAGDTCCQAADLRNAVSMLNRRIDLILFKSSNDMHGHDGLGAVFADVVGDETRDRTPSGLWPSDHAGVVASMRIPAASSRSGHPHAVATQVERDDTVRALYHR